MDEIIEQFKLDLANYRIKGLNITPLIKALILKIKSCDRNILDADE